MKNREFHGNAGLVFPPEVRFTCSRCGDCCRGWHVMLGPGEAERLEALDWSGAAPELAGISPAPPFRASLDRPHGARAKSGRRLHLPRLREPVPNPRVVRGSRETPSVPWLYPFGFFPVGERVAVDVSFACRAVSRDQGEPLSRRVPEWTRLLEAAPSRRKRTSSRRSTRSRAASCGSSSTISFRFSRRESLAPRLRSRGFRVQPPGDDERSHDGGGGADPEGRAGQGHFQTSPRAAHRAGLRGHGQDGPGGVLPSALPHAEPHTGRALGDAWQSEGREAGFRVQAADGYKFPEAHPLVDNRERRATFGEVGRVTASSVLSGPSGEFLACYLRAKILGQRFMREGDAISPSLRRCLGFSCSSRSRSGRRRPLPASGEPRRLGKTTSEARSVSSTALMAKSGFRLFRLNRGRPGASCSSRPTCPFRLVRNARL